MAQGRYLAKGRIGYAGTSSALSDLTFQYNPQTITYNRQATYSKNQAAFADFPNSAPSSIPSLTWIRNEAEEISMEIIFHEDGQKNVEDKLLALDEFMKPDANTGKPRDLFFSFGMGRSDRIRILQKTVVGSLFDNLGRCQEAKVQLKFTALASRVKP